MTTTIIKDSQIGDAWIKECATLNPVSRVIDPKTGQPNGNILTGPVRLAFCDDLFTPRALNPTQQPKYGTVALYTPFADLTIMYEEYYKILAVKFPEYYVPQQNNYAGLEVPFHDQAAKIKFAGFTPGCAYMTHTTRYKPQIVDSRGNPITTQDKVYAGCWAILAVNPYDYGKSPPQPKKGVAFGLQQVMIIGEDTRLAGGAPDPRVTFAGVNVKPPVVSPAAQFGNLPVGGQPGAALNSLYPTHVGGFAPPPGLGALAPPALTIPADEDVSALY